MTDDEKTEFAALIEGLFAAFNREATRATYAGFWLGLKSLSIDEVASAAAKAIELGGEHPPTAGRLRELAGALTPDMKALVAWDTVRAAIREHGKYRTVQFSDPLVTAAVRLIGGWQRLCACERSELDTWARKEFERAYGELMQSGAPQALTVPLPGLFEMSGNADKASARPRMVAIDYGVKRAPALGPVEGEGQRLLEGSR